MEKCEGSGANIGRRPGLGVVNPAELAFLESDGDFDADRSSSLSVSYPL